METLGAISKSSCQLAGQPSPIHKAPETYLLPVAQMVEGLQRVDAPAVPQLAIPVAVPKHMHKMGQLSNSELQLPGNRRLLINSIFLSPTHWQI